MIIKKDSIGSIETSGFRQGRHKQAYGFRVFFVQDVKHPQSWKK
jgi:hypothetical protein